MDPEILTIIDDLSSIINISDHRVYYNVITFRRNYLINFRSIPDIIRIHYYYDEPHESHFLGYFDLNKNYQLIEYLKLLTL